LLCFAEFKNLELCRKIEINQEFVNLTVMKTFEKWEYKSQETFSLLKVVQDKVHSLLPGADIILYGSQARLEADAESDWDFLILSDGQPDQQIVAELRDRLYDLELESGTVLSAIVRSRDEWYSELYSILPFKETVERDGVIL
jgi:predicted nucleotidyltransferase